MNRDYLRVGLIGLGAMGRNHARVLGQLDGVELVAVAEPNHSEKPPRGLPLVETVQDVVGAGVDYAVVACPTAQHEEVGVALARAGIPALIEKPLAHTVVSARLLVEAFESRGLTAAVGHIERYNPALQNLRCRLAAGELGDVYQVSTRRQGPFPSRVGDVGVVSDLCSHDIDLTAWITGAEYTSVSARTARRSGRQHEDMVVVVGELEDGIVVNHVVNWLSPFKERCITVSGERGSFVADTLTADLTFHANGAISTQWEALSNFRGVSEGDVTRFAIPKREPLFLEHEHFRDAIRWGAQRDIVTLRQASRTVEVCAAVLQSAASGTTVSVQPH
jgi:UDP-N-acetylglucosamine 3-dehydrogenase